MAEQLRLMPEEIRQILARPDATGYDYEQVADAATAQAVRWMADRLDGMGLEAARNVLLFQAHVEGLEVSNDAH